MSGIETKIKEIADKLSRGMITGIASVIDDIPLRLQSDLNRVREANFAIPYVIRKEIDEMYVKLVQEEFLNNCGKWTEEWIKSGEPQRIFNEELEAKARRDAKKKIYGSEQAPRGSAAL